MTKLTMYRLIADEGKLVTNGKFTGSVIDVAPSDDVDSYYEIDEPKEETEEVENQDKPSEY